MTQPSRSAMFVSCLCGRATVKVVTPLVTVPPDLLPSKLLLNTFVEVVISLRHHHFSDTVRDQSVSISSFWSWLGGRAGIGAWCSCIYCLAIAKGKRTVKKKPEKTDWLWVLHVMKPCRAIYPQFLRLLSALVICPRLYFHATSNVALVLNLKALTVEKKGLDIFWTYNLNQNVYLPSKM